MRVIGGLLSLRNCNCGQAIVTTAPDKRFDAAGASGTLRSLHCKGHTAMAAAEAVEIEKTTAERLFEAARDSDVAALDALLPDATAEQLHEEHRYEYMQGRFVRATPLFAAAWDGHDAIVRRLISAGAYVERGSSIGLTPLMAAAATNRHGCAVALLEAGTDVNHEVRDDRFKFRVLHVAVHGWASPEVIRLLVSRGAGVDAVSRDARGESTPLSLAFNRLHPPDVTDADTRRRYFLNRHSVAFMLLRAGADVSLSLIHI